MSRPPWLTDARKNLRKTGLDTEGKDQDDIPGTFHQSDDVTVPRPDNMTVAATTGTHARTDTAIAAGVVHGPVGSKITNVVYKDTEEPLKHNLRRLENKLRIHQRQLCGLYSLSIQKLENDLEQQQDSATRDDVPNAEEQICQLEDEIKMHKSEIARLENEVLPDLMAKRDEVKEQLDKHEQTSQDKMDDIPVLKEKMQSLIKDLEKYGTDVAREREKVAHLSRLIGKLDKDFKQKESDEKRAIQELKTQVETIRAEQVKQSLHLQDEMKDLQEWKKEMQKQHDERLREVQDRLREEKAARESAERTIQELKDRHARDADNSQGVTERCRKG
ncbi:uncharacterized protein PF3D7_1120000-like [Haliotis cracherodii]|uniref:uncharacterized protein PF3D7_1120000-like n=1 Tax=Haliotis cracherodii TaxID=6455 RepID=UPI0039E9CD3D